jgi:thioredoxin-like negative regulator of GroEL
LAQYKIQCVPVQPISSDELNLLIENNAVIAVYVGVGWSPACREFAPVFESLVPRRSDVQFAYVDADANPALASQFEVRGFPTILIYKNGAISHTAP